MRVSGVGSRVFRVKAAVCVAACLVLSGCGMKEYEDHMDEEEIFLKKFDEENKALGDPLGMPVRMVPGGNSMIEDDALRIRFFFRPPRWISSKVKDKDAQFPNLLPKTG